MKISKKRFLEGFIIVTLVLSLVRCFFPSIAKPKATTEHKILKNRGTEQKDSSIETTKENTLKNTPIPLYSAKQRNYNSKFFNPDGSIVKNKIFSVPGYSRTFSDQQDVQYVSAKQWGVSPVINREDAEHRKSELVFIGSNPYFHVDKLRNSIPYLVPRASLLLQDIGSSFFDSLQIKDIPLHKLIVTSVTRTQEDVEKLRSHNSNATENSCHLYGTTFDVCYNRYQTVKAPGENRRDVRNDTLKYVLAEVLRDMRVTGRCHVKYEVKQGCFHITVK